MNKTIIELELLYSDAKKDPSLKRKLLATSSADDPMDVFCKIACDAGHPITVGELLAIGQEYSDNQCKSTNGGNPDPYDSFEDTYETFLASLSSDSNIDPRSN
ncbi:hypothetical protein [Clostridium luticellarii]|jgi:hypothetical protein|uniref:Nif11 domain-containing protein n=1 Tax=Clostridium luticellarii TaxID=1691940 RepID=A0A2T0B6J6_9CLOT|nr:hypothetical protein [Clostridium luticellarii]MCI1945224.1 hypothetical protein [Clostridium luticellarii]MCI1969638.1 hypothetical protein [Clostridium luticellarii]MCI1994557.1 hypothetical protein [Clostridium luticellarii]MCI2038946.1 hypothetical protein [Clostridium luticellarii]PRR79510.1 hypothetical protein CLLU_35040 [Clostridium luticellarii]